MPLYSKNGSYPKPQTDGTNGWIQVLDPPTEIPEGKQLAWLNWEWVIRDPKPEDRPGYQWNWVHATKEWVECEYAATADETTEPKTDEIVTGLSMDFPASSTTSLSFSLIAPSITSTGDI